MCEVSSAEQQYIFQNICARSSLHTSKHTWRNNVTLATSGSEATRLQNRVMAVGPSSIPSSMLMSRTWAPISTWALAMLNASWTTRQHHKSVNVTIFRAFSFSLDLKKKWVYFCYTSKFPAMISLANLREPATLQRSPMLTKLVYGPTRYGSRPASKDQNSYNKWQHNVCQTNNDK